jgi:hypothetical protein
MLEAMTQAFRTTDLVDAIWHVLHQSEEPLTPTRIRVLLPPPLHTLPLEVLQMTLRRQVAAHVVVLYPKYRSDQDRYWDRPLPVHVEQLLRRILRDGPMTRSDLRRRLPAYARILADNVLDALLAHGRIHEHPSQSRRAASRLALYPADPRLHLRPELDALFTRLARLGFRRCQLRDAALAVLHEDGWSAAAPFDGDRRAAQLSYTTDEELLTTV